MRFYYQKALDKMTEKEREEFFIGKHIFKQILLKSTMMIAELMGIRDIVIEKVTITDADLSYKLDRFTSNNIVPWQVNQVNNINTATEDDYATYDSYTIRYDYYENYRQWLEISIIPPVSEQFFETMLIGLIHELRHVMQFENLVNGYRDVLQIINDMTQEEFDKLDFKAFSKQNAELLESDAISFSEGFYTEHSKEINMICQKEIFNMQDRINCQWYDPEDFYKYRELI